MFQFDETFDARLAALNPRQRLAFMAALCERLQPNYALYAQTTGSGDASALGSILALLWESLAFRQARIDFERQAEKLAQLEPPAADDSFGARRALEAVTALGAALDTLRGEAPGAMYEVSLASRGGVRAFIELTEGEEDEARLTALVREHPLMADEQNFQLAVLETLEERSLDRDTLKALRDLGRNGGVSNLGLVLD